ncbi:MAG: cellulase family glycosylhydrolase [Anaerolineae bacterium]
MSKLIKIGGVALGVILLLVAGVAVLAATSENLRFHLPVEQKAQFEHEGLADFPPALHVEGNRLVTAGGEVVRLRGLMPADAYEMEGEKHFDREFFEELAASGANVVRLPVHPHTWTENPDYLWRYLDPAVGWAGELGLYVIVDWHSIGNVETGQAPLMPELYSHTEEMTLDFWTQVAGYFRDAPNVLFEVFNEPQGISAGAWQAAASELVSTIRGQGAAQPAIVGGIDYARDLSWVLQSPLADGNVVYASHIYPAHAESLWGLYFGRVAEAQPVLITEWGFMEENPSAGQPYLNGTAAGYGQALMSYLDERGIGWVACWYDDEAEPPMFRPDWEGLTGYGQFVMGQLEGSK